MTGLFFLYDLKYTSFSSFKTQCVYEKHYKHRKSQEPLDFFIFIEMTTSLKIYGF